MELPEGIREKFDLPNHILDLYATAYHAEVAWHIFDVFGYETGVLSERDWREIYAMYCHEDAHATHGLKRVSACNAFARFVKAKGGAAEFGMKDAQMADWQPCEEPFNWVEFEVEPR